MRRYILTDPAKDDVRGVVAFIRRDNPTAAKRVRVELHEAMRHLAEMPEIGHRRSDVPDESLKFWSVYSYVIAYQPKSKPLVIVRVLHGARDLPRFFR